MIEPINVERKGCLVRLRGGFRLHRKGCLVRLRGGFRLHRKGRLVRLRGGFQQYQRIRLLPPDRIAIPVRPDRGWPDDLMSNFTLRDRLRADDTGFARALSCIAIRACPKERSAREAFTNSNAQASIEAM